MDLTCSRRGKDRYHLSAEHALSHAHERKSHSTRPPSDRLHGGARILIVEDNEGVSGPMRKLLMEQGFRVDAFGAGLPALKHAAAHPPQAAVIDVHLPDVNGLVLTSQLRQQLGPDVPLIVLSGDTSLETINSLSLVGATYFFPKPLKWRELLARLKEWVK